MQPNSLTCPPRDDAVEDADSRIHCLGLSLQASRNLGAFLLFCPAVFVALPALLDAQQDGDPSLYTAMDSSRVQGEVVALEHEQADGVGKLAGDATNVLDVTSR
eukprot:760178-Hanusia_phi.AAC.3